MCFVSIEHNLKGRKADQEWNARVEKWYTIASEDPRRTHDMESKNIYFRKGGFGGGHYWKLSRKPERKRRNDQALLDADIFDQRRTVSTVDCL